MKHIAKIIMIWWEIITNNFKNKEDMEWFMSDIKTEKTVVISSSWNIIQLNTLRIEKVIYKEIKEESKSVWEYMV